DQFNMQQAQALYAICSTCDDTNKSVIMAVEDPKIAFDLLVTMHGDDNGLTIREWLLLGPFLA
ncbi:hypothetical protein CROQUDRAFT_54118, partial [Cronartium quercuum f. sp. fusiforme G11]